ncbi:hypothetical protein IGI65_001470 [Enterococcus sp. DIV0755b]|uniref:cell division site-positioning protein MapZ family protein n=1 Tax=Enterococcus sp. DIV0755b TaxID=2774657 RepID=UPI003F23B55A
MINKCPHCGFEPLDGQMVCPRCGEEIKENIAGKLATIKENNLDNNDSVKWSDFKDVSIGSVMEESLNEATKEDDLADVNPILADYIKKHKDDYEEPETPKLGDVAEKSETTTAASLEPDQPKSSPEIVAGEENGNSVDNDEKLNEETDPAKSEPVEPEITAVEEEPSNETKIAALNDQEIIDSSATKNESIENEATEEQEAMDDPIDSASISQTNTPADKVDDETASDSESLVSNPAKTANSSKEERVSEIGNTTKAPRKKWPFVLLATAIILGGGGYGYYVHDQNVKAQARQEQQKIEAQETSIKEKLADFYTDTSHQFIKADKTNTQLEDLTKEVNELKKKANTAGTKEQLTDLANEINSLQEKMTIVAAVNNLFESPVVNGSQVKTTVAIKGDDVNVDPLTTDDEFSKAINNVISDAKSQLNDLNAAKKAMAVIYADDKVKDSVSRQQYQTAQKAVAKLFDGVQKKTLTENLKKVDDTLTKKEAAAAKKQQEAQAAAEQQATEQAAKSQSEQQNNSLPAEASPNMHPNNNNEPIMATNPSAVADTSNPAWVWNAGIKEKVIQTCIDRGYIVAGGYYLEPVTIENGEGYYNLFATNTKSSLLKGISEKALPYYIVTINCKTGYFRGNGNDHTIR